MITFMKEGIAIIDNPHAGDVAFDCETASAGKTTFAPDILLRDDMEIYPTVDAKFFFPLDEVVRGGATGKQKQESDGE